jgi:ketosteroid isomerase-like protein
MTADDRFEIEQLVARFDDAVNRRDPDEFRRLWTEDGVWEIGEPFPLTVRGADAVTATWAQMLGAMTWLFRGSFAGVLVVDGDGAQGRWPCVETGTFSDGRGYDNRAVYEDRYERRDGRWLFAHRRYLYLWLSQEPLPGAPVALGAEITDP